MRQWKACSQGRMTTPLPFGDEFEAVHGFADEVGGLVAGAGDVVHAEEVRGIDHGAEHVAVVGHADDVLSGMGEVDLALPGHHAEDVEREQDAGGMEFGVGLFQEGGDDVGALRAAGCRLWRRLDTDLFALRALVAIDLRLRLAPVFLWCFGDWDRAGRVVAHGSCRPLESSRLSGFRLAVLEDELGVFLVAFGGEADVVELDFVDAELGYVLGQGDVVILNFGLAGIGPDQLAVFAPGGVVLAGLDGEFGMLLDQALVAEDGDAGDGVHVLLVQEVHELRHVMDVDLVLAEQRVLEGNGHAAVGILDVEDDGVAANFAPVADDAESVVAARHDAGQVDGADFKVFGNGNGLFGDRGGEDSGDDDVLVGFENVGGRSPLSL